MRWLWPILVYVVLVIAILAAMFKARVAVIDHLGTPNSLADWETWREDVRQQKDRSAPVERRIPKSPEPPALVMMRDHFAVSLTGILLFSSMLYWVLAWFIMGILSQRRSVSQS
jgi:hypothetical protein